MFWNKQPFNPDDVKIDKSQHSKDNGFRAFNPHLLAAARTVCVIAGDIDTTVNVHARRALQHSLAQRKLDWLVALTHCNPFKGGAVTEQAPLIPGEALRKASAQQLRDMAARLNDEADRIANG